MTDMKTTFLGLLLLTATAISAQEQARHIPTGRRPPLQPRKQVTDMTLHPLPKKGAKHLSSFLSVCRTVTTK